MVACIHRAIAAGELPATVMPQTLAAVFDSFLLGLSPQARDGLPHATLDAAVTQVMGIWDSLRTVATINDLLLQKVVEESGIR